MGSCRIHILSDWSRMPFLLNLQNNRNPCWDKHLWSTYNQDTFVHIMFTNLYVDMCPCNMDCICRIPSYFIFCYRFSNVSCGDLYAIEWGLQVYWESAEVLFWVCTSLHNYICIHALLISRPLKQSVQTEEILL